MFGCCRSGVPLATVAQRWGGCFKTISPFGRSPTRWTGIRNMAVSGSGYYDIGLNLTDPMYRGVYNGRSCHESDVREVLSRARQRDVRCALLTGSSLVESKDAISLANSSDLSDSGVQLYYTIGVHPCCVNEFANHDVTIDNPSMNGDLNEALHSEVLQNPASGHLKLRELYELVQKQLSGDPLRFRAIGEIGLDYDRFHYSGQKMQLLFFEEQLKLSCLIGDPKLSLFLHMRSSCDDFVIIMKKFITGFHDHDDIFGWRSIIQADSEKPLFYKFHQERKFVTHSFTGSQDDLQKILSLSPNSYVGMNGCSLKSKENLVCAEKVPIDKLLLETDAPWCDIRRTHDSYQFLTNYEPPYKSVKRDKLSKLLREDWAETMVKGRNEPCNMEQVAQVIANVKKVPLDDLIETVWKNSCKVYGGPF